MPAFLYFAMFEKLTRKWGAKATDNAIEGAKETLNDRMDKYSDIIQIGLVVAVIALGGNKLIGHHRKNPQSINYIPENTGSPIVINNYYTQSPMERDIYGKKGARAAHGRKTGQNYQKR